MKWYHLITIVVFVGICVFFTGKNRSDNSSAHTTSSEGKQVEGLQPKISEHSQKLGNERKDHSSSIQTRSTHPTSDEKASDVSSHPIKQTKATNNSETKNEGKLLKLDYNPLEGYGPMGAYKSLVNNSPRVFPPAPNNQIFTKALLGRNRSNLQVIEESADYINDKGELIDRWGTPLELHYVSSNSIGIRSAGPDRELFTKDDYHLPASEAVRMIEKE